MVTFDIPQKEPMTFPITRCGWEGEGNFDISVFSRRTIFPDGEDGETTVVIVGSMGEVATSETCGGFIHSTNVHLREGDSAYFLSVEGGRVVRGTFIRITKEWKRSQRVGARLLTGLSLPPNEWGEGEGL